MTFEKIVVEFLKKCNLKATGNPVVDIMQVFDVDIKMYIDPKIKPKSGSQAISTKLSIKPNINSIPILEKTNKKSEYLFEKEIKPEYSVSLGSKLSYGKYFDEWFNKLYKSVIIAEGATIKFKTLEKEIEQADGETVTNLKAKKLHNN